jgi:hypothetical protein
MQSTADPRKDSDVIGMEQVLDKLQFESPGAVLPGAFYASSINCLNSGRLLSMVS